jgi:O-antigen/teichoic acid export membrane protein
MFLLIWLNIDDILHILPEKFQSGKYVVLFIGLSQVVNLACGLNGLIIINSKYFKADLLFNVVLLTFIVITNILLIPKMGIDGAALASLLSIIIHNIIKLIYIYVKIKIQPFDFKSIKLFLISVLVYFIIQLTPMIENSILSVILKTILVLSIFIPLVISMKISNDINDFYKNLILKIYKLFR